MLRSITLLVLIGSAGTAAPIPPTAVTFNRDVLPILQQKCQECHRPGEVAPMSFMTYNETRPWAKAIKSAILTFRRRLVYRHARYGDRVSEERVHSGDGIDGSVKPGGEG
jgi:hypothetical protein